MAQEPEFLPIAAESDVRPQNRLRAPATNTVLAYEADLRGLLTRSADTRRSAALLLPPKLVASYL
jgi:hypothetical protein